jgi:hypothetical protein
MPIFSMCCTVSGHDLVTLISTNHHLEGERYVYGLVPLSTSSLARASVGSQGFKRRYETTLMISGIMGGVSLRFPNSLMV